MPSLLIQSCLLHDALLLSRLVLPFVSDSLQTGMNVHGQAFFQNRYDFANDLRRGAPARGMMPYFILTPAVSNLQVQQLASRQISSGCSSSPSSLKLVTFFVVNSYLLLLRWHKPELFFKPSFARFHARSQDYGLFSKPCSLTLAAMYVLVSSASGSFR